jgi:hypothetical protein
MFKVWIQSGWDLCSSMCLFSDSLSLQRKQGVLPGLAGLRQERWELLFFLAGGGLTRSSSKWVVFVLGLSSLERAALLRQACNKHVMRAALCKLGLGVDRHLMGLRQLANWRLKVLPRYELPALFQDPSYWRLINKYLLYSSSRVLAQVGC